MSCNLFYLKRNDALSHNYQPAATREDLEEMQYCYDERAGIIEFDGGSPREEAEQLAAELMGFLNKEAFDYFIRVRLDEIEFKEATGKDLQETFL
ncbi:hypothetical protein DSS3PM1_00097 [Bacteriophage DSS3_PM1]|nr:hypothetical protein DSS3PM1_00097 [Bacteriophage DSS3_PM1]